MNYPPNQVTAAVPGPVPPRQPRGNRGTRDGLKTFQNRAGGAGLMHTPPPYKPPQSQNRVPLLQPQHPLYMNPGAAAAAVAAAAAPGSMMRAAGNPVFIPGMYNFSAAALQQQQSQMMFNTQQPIALGHNMSAPNLGQPQPGATMPMAAPPPHTMRHPMQGNIMYPTPEQQEPTPMMQPQHQQHQQQPRPTKSRSHAIKIVDPSTLTEVKLDGSSPALPPTADPTNGKVSSEFKEKVLSAVGGSGATTTTATTTTTTTTVAVQPPPVATEEAGKVGVASHRPNAIITAPDEAKKEPKQVEGASKENVGVASAEKGGGAGSGGDVVVEVKESAAENGKQEEMSASSTTSLPSSTTSSTTLSEPGTATPPAAAAAAVASDGSATTLEAATVAATLETPAAATPETVVTTPETTTTTTAAATTSSAATTTTAAATDAPPKPTPTPVEATPIPEVEQIAERPSEETGQHERLELPAEAESKLEAKSKEELKEVQGGVGVVDDATPTDVAVVDDGAKELADDSKPATAESADPVPEQMQAEERIESSSNASSSVAAVASEVATANTLSSSSSSSSNSSNSSTPVVQPKSAPKVEPPPVEKPAPLLPQPPAPSTTVAVTLPQPPAPSTTVAATLPQPPAPSTTAATTLPQPPAPSTTAAATLTQPPAPSTTAAATLTQPPAPSTTAAATLTQPLPPSTTAATTLSQPRVPSTTAATTSELPSTTTTTKEPAPPTVTTPTNRSKQDQEQGGGGKIKSKTPPPPQKSHVGRQMYDRNFLMQFRTMPMCQEKPKGLELSSLELFHDSPRMNFNNNRSNRSNSRRGSEKKVIAYQPAAEKVELNKAEVRWTRPVERLAPEVSSEEEVQTEELYRKFQGILNKLTPQKFQSLAEQALQLDINTEERLSGCIDKIFTKALEEPSFSIAYANLCKVMSPIKVEFSLDGGKTKKNTNFRRMLLTKCQTEFEKDKKDDETLEKMREGIKEAETKEKVALEKELSLTIVRMRKRSLGNIRFIGELFKLKMLSETIMHECITRLLKSSSDEEALECFGKLIMTTGKDLDHPEAKPRIDTYFRRMTEIIKKSKIPARIKFLLQDVQDMRDNRWVPRVRQDKQLKTIDQIHAEAKIEQEKEKEMIQQHQVVNYRGGGGGRDSRRGSKMGGDDWQGKGGGGGGDRGDRTKESREKFDHSKVTGILNRRIKEKTTQVSLGPTAALRPSAGAWKKGSGATTSAPQDTTTAKSAKPSRSSSSGTKRLGPDRGPGSSSSRGAASSGVKRASTTPEQEREAALQTVSQFTNTPAATPTAPPTKDAPAHAVRVERKPVAALLETPPPAPEPMDEVKITRKTISIVDELVNNVDYKEAVECVRLMPKEALDVMVRESINHTLEKSSEFRVTAGKLFSKLVQDKVLTQQKFLAGLSDVLECAEDIAIDIPRIWSYLGEILAPVMSHSTLSLSLLNDVPPSLVESGGAAKLVAKVLQQCQKVSGSEEAVRDLWLQSRLGWPALGMRDEDLGEFLVDQDLAYLSEQVKGQMAEASYLFELQQILASDRTNGDVNDWIKGNCTEVGTEVGSLAFMRNLSIAIAGASVNGTGGSAIFNTDLFEKRMDIVKGHVTAAAAITGAQNLELGLQVLNGLQVKVAQLSHPPKLLNKMMDHLYNNDVLGEEDFMNWLDNGDEMFGRGNAVMSVSGFFKWLRAEEPVDQT